MQILLADDQLDTRQLYSLMFRLDGHTTTLAENGEAAIQAAAEQAFDVILMDAEMPGINGLTAIQHIRALPQGQEVPIILFTAYGYTETESYAAGADLLVRKPILLRDLLEKIKQARSTPPRSMAPQQATAPQATAPQAPPAPESPDQVAEATDQLPRFVAAPLMAATLRAALALHWQVSENLAESLVDFNVSHTMPPGQVVTLNPAAAQLLEAMELSSLAVERRSVPRAETD